MQAQQAAAAAAVVAATVAGPVVAAPSARFKRLRELQASTTSSVIPPAPPLNPHIDLDSVSALSAILREATLDRTFPCSMPLAFAHQVSQIIKHNSLHELVEARKGFAVRFFIVEPMGNAVLLGLESDYRSLVSKLLEAARATNALDEYQVLHGFLHKLLPQVSDSFVEARHVNELIPRARVETVLLRMGLLVHKTDAGPDSKSFYFSVPQVGRLLGEIDASRKWMLKAIKAQPARRLLKSKARAIKRKFLLSFEYVCKDAVGAGLVDVYDEGLEVCFKLPRD